MCVSAHPNTGARPPLVSHTTTMGHAATHSQAYCCPLHPHGAQCLSFPMAPSVLYLCCGSGEGSQAHPSPPPHAADRPCGQEPPAGDGAHGARAGHRLVPSQRQRHRQRLRGHHRYGEGRAVGGVWRAPPPSLPVALPPAKCHRPIFRGSAMRVCCWRRPPAP